MSVMPFRLALPMLGALLAGAPALAAPPAPSSATYVMKAGAGDLYEERSSTLVLATSKSPQVREFATMMLKDHATSTSEVKAAAMKSGMKPKPPMLDAKQAAMIHQLGAVSGPARDHLYHDQQMKAHDEALMLHQSYASAGGAPALKQAAASIVPVVQHHIELLKAMPSS